MTMSSQTFFPGHEDIDKSHSGSADGTHCTKCRMDLRGRGDLRIAQDDTGAHKVLRRENQLKDRIKRETNQMTQANLLRALKQLYPGARPGPPPPPVEEKPKGHPVVGENLSALKTGALTPGQRQTARQNAEKALAVALFHTDPRIHAHLLMDAANDDPDTMDQALAHAWRNDLNTWRTQAVERAAKMVAVMDGLGEASP